MLIMRVKPENHNRKYRAAEVTQIAQMYHDGISDGKIAETLGRTTDGIRHLRQTERIFGRKTAKLRGNAINLTITLDRETDKRFRELASAKGVTRSSVCLRLIKTWLRNQELINGQA